MKKTQLKRYTPLRAKTGLKRTAMKIKPKRYPISKEELAKVDERSGGECEFHSNNYWYCVGELEYAHIIHRGIGGAQGKKANIINDHRNITKICRIVHDFIDKRIFKWESRSICGSGISREEMIKILKQKIGWHEWYAENKGVINR